MKKETSFTDDIRNFGITLLTGLMPLVLFTELFIDRIAKIFKLQPFTAFCIYLVVYFLMPLVILIGWSFVYKNQRVSEEENSGLTNFIPGGFMLICMCMVASFFLPKTGMLILCVLPCLAAGVAFMVAGWKLSSGMKSLKEYTTIRVEFTLIVTAALLLGFGYVMTNVDDVRTIHTWIDLNSPAFAVSLRDGNDALSPEWNELIQRTNLIGTLSLFSMLVLFACGWYYYSLLNLIKKNSAGPEKKSMRLISSPDGYTVEEPEFRNIAAQSTFKILILYVVLLIIPVFQPVKVDKDKQHPFLNLVQMFRLQINPPVVISDPGKSVEPIRYDSIRTIIHAELKGIRDSIPYLHATFESVRSLQDKFDGTRDKLAEFHSTRGKKVEDPLNKNN